MDKRVPENNVKSHIEAVKKADGEKSSQAKVEPSFLDWNPDLLGGSASGVAMRMPIAAVVIPNAVKKEKKK